MGQTKTASRNGFVDIQKFVFSLIIVIFHFYDYTREHFVGGGTLLNSFSSVQAHSSMLGIKGKRTLLLARSGFSFRSNT